MYYVKTAMPIIHTFQNVQKAVVKCKFFSSHDKEKVHFLCAVIPISKQRAGVAALVKMSAACTRSPLQ
jgi:hypothetical protein